jgi:hypothetical protein
MTARQCFTNKVRAGKVSARAGKAMLELIDQFEKEKGVGIDDDPVALRKSAIQAAIETRARASREADILAGSIVAQANVLRAAKAYEGKVEALRGTRGDFGFGNKAPPTLGKTTQTPLGFALRSLLARDPWEIASWNNVHALAQSIRAGAHAAFAQALDHLRPKMLGFAAEHAKELDVLRALKDKRTDVHPDAVAAAKSFSDTAESLRQQYVEAGGVLPARKNWGLPNPDMDPAKVRALGRDGFRDLVNQHVDRDDMLDFVTGRRLSDARYADLVDRAFDTVSSNGVKGVVPEATASGSTMLANSRDVGRFFSWKSAESWMAIAETIGTHQSPFHTMVAHINGMADDIAAMRILGPNPSGTLRFMEGLFDREGKRLAVEAENKTGPELAAATRQNNAIENRVRVEKRLTQDLYGEVLGLNRIPVSTTMAKGLADVRHTLSAAQLGSALISSFTDIGTMAMTARMNAMPVMSVIRRALELATTKGSEVHLAQMGMTADAMAHAAGQVDRLMGETIRLGTAAKLSGAVIRASGLQRWTQMLRGAFGLEMQAMLAREQGKAFGALEPELKEALGRYGIAEKDWDVIQGATPHQPRPGAPFLRPQDVADREVSEKLARMIHNEMDYAVIERDPVMRAMLVGDTKPGTVSGELRRSVSMYRSFSGSIVTYHVARALARGWDGSRMAHGALTFMAMTALGALSMQAKELNQGRDALSLDPRTAKGLQAWGKAVIQGGGLGVFGDVVFADKTRMDSSWASVLGGPILSGAEDVLGKFLIRNMQLAAQGKPTHFAGDALYAAGRYMPGSSLWYAKLAFNRAVLDQAAQMIDPRARERFRRLEQGAQKDFGQQYWWHPGQAMPSRAPAIMGAP